MFGDKNNVNVHNNHIGCNFCTQSFLELGNVLEMSLIILTVLFLLKESDDGISHEAVQSLLQKFAIQDFIRYSVQCRTTTATVHL